MNTHIFRSIEIVFLDCVIFLLSSLKQSGIMRLVFVGTKGPVTNQDLFLTAVLISMSCFVGVVSGYLCYIMFNGVR